MIQNRLVITLASKISILIWSPEVLETFFFDCLPRVLCVWNTLSWHENCTKAHFGIEPSVCIGVPKRIKLPANLWDDLIFAAFSELFHQKGVSDLEILNHICICWTCFIFHWPGSIHKFNLTIENQLFELLPPLFRFFTPPHAEELQFHVSEFPLLIFQ